MYAASTDCTSAKDGGGEKPLLLILRRDLVVLGLLLLAIRAVRFSSSV